MDYGNLTELTYYTLERWLESSSGVGLASGKHGGRKGLRQLGHGLFLASHCGVTTAHGRGGVQTARFAPIVTIGSWRCSSTGSAPNVTIGSWVRETRWAPNVTSRVTMC